MYLKRITLSVFILFCLHFASVGQQTDYEKGCMQQKQYEEQPLTIKKINKEQWTALKQKIKIKEEKPKKTEKKKSAEQKEWELNLPPAVRLYIKWMLFGGILLALLLLVMKVLGINPFKGKTSRKNISITLEEIEDHLDTAAIDPFLYAAIKDKNFKLAIRLYYLMIIQQFSFKGIINWKKYKTNKQYMSELNGSDEYYAIFKKLTLLYEECWFGNKTISETEYETIQPEFVNFLHHLK